MWLQQAASARHADLLSQGSGSHQTPAANSEPGNMYRQAQPTMAEYEEALRQAE